MDNSNLTAADAQAFDTAQLAISANEALDSAVNQATHQAFNLGCLIGLLPAAIFSLVMFFITGFSLIGAFMAIIIGIIGAIAFANLAAMFTRRNTTRRVYRDTIAPNIERTLKANGVSRADFDNSAGETLDSSAPLYEFLEIRHFEKRVPPDAEGMQNEQS